MLLIPDGISNWLVIGVFDPAAPATIIDAALVSSTPDSLTVGRLARYDTTAGDIVANLPLADSLPKNASVTVKNEVGGNNVLVTRAGADTIDSVVGPHTVAPVVAFRFVTNGSDNWTAV